MNILNRNNEKGSILIFAILFAIIVAILGDACYVVFNNFVVFTKKHESNLYERYIAECGACRAKWLIDEAVVIVPAGSVAGDIIYDSNNPGPAFTVNGTTVDITVIYNGLDDYAIVSTASDKNINLNYKDGKITYWG